MAFNVLVSSAGRRVQLLDGFRRALRDLNEPGLVGALDASQSAPAYLLADQQWQVPRLDDPSYMTVVESICRDNDIRLLIPTIDTELASYARSVESFADFGCTVAVSQPEAIAIAADKRHTHQWLVANGFPTVDQFEVEHIRTNPTAASYPLIAKPVAGSMSQGIQIVHAVSDLPGSGDPDLILQSIASGSEYTVSVLVNRDGKCRAAVPRRRLEVRHGEVSKGVTVRNDALEQLAADVAQALPGAFGALNVQIFWDEQASNFAIIEINARFGGGDPLAWQAGADFPKWMIEELLGKGAEPRPDAWSGGVTMLRFDRATYVSPDGSVTVG